MPQEVALEKGKKTKKKKRGTLGQIIPGALQPWTFQKAFYILLGRQESKLVVILETGI